MHEWNSEPLNALSPEVVERVRAALDDSLVYGFQYFYCAGHGPEYCAFSHLDSYLERVTAGRPGDRFILWSVGALDRQGMLRLRKRGAEATDAELSQIDDWLKDFRDEFLAVGRTKAGAAPEAICGDYDYFEELKELAKKCAGTGELAVLSLSDLEFYSDGLKRFVLVDAKRPNEKGEVPLGGAY